MKKFLLMALATISAVSFTACSDDDDEPVKTPAEAVAGTYTGSISGNSVVTNDGETLVITANADGTISLTQPGFYTPNYNDGKWYFTGAAVNKITVEKTEEGYTFYSKYVSSNGGMGVNGEVWGTVKGKEITFDYTYYHAGLLDDPLIHFVGKKD